MTGCFTWLLLAAGFIFVMMSLLRWFEQTAEAVEQRQWGRVLLLVTVPFSVWFFPARVGAGRPVPVPRHEPVRGMGTAPKAKGPRGAAAGVGESAPVSLADSRAPSADSRVSEGPPPGTPREFLGMPVIPPKKASKPGVDPEKLAKLREKMREQGMLGEEE